MQFTYDTCYTMREVQICTAEDGAALLAADLSLNNFSQEGNSKSREEWYQQEKTKYFFTYPLCKAVSKMLPLIPM